MMKGSCHCGDVKFEVDAVIKGPVIECNCSHWPQGLFAVVRAPR